MASSGTGAVGFEAKVERADLRCILCGGAGHLSSECPSRRLASQQRNQSNQQGESRQAAPAPRDHQAAQLQAETVDESGEAQDTDESDRQ